MSYDESYVFDPYELRGGELFVGGRALDVEPLVLQFLQRLVSTDGVVSADDIKRAIWPTTRPPADAALHNLASKARRALVECTDNPILAIRGAGYRFNLPVERRRPAGERVIGRSRELAELRELVCASRPGLQLKLITGEAGCGKTTLVQEFARRIEKSATTCAFARCFDGREAPPFWPWQDLWSSLFPSDGSLTEGIVDADDFVASEEAVVGGAERRRLAHRILSRLRQAGSDQPLVLIFDDVHLASEEALELLSFLCTATSLQSVSVVATRRPAAQSKARHAIERLERYARELELQPLGRRSALELIRASCPIQLTDVAERDLLARANGNPLFLKELARIVPAGTERQLPSLISAAIDDHLCTLPAETRRVLDAAALIGERFEMRLLSDALSVTHAQVVDTLAAAAGVVRMLSLREASFTHALYQQRLNETQDSSTKRRTHRLLGQVRSNEGANTSPNQLGAIARHLSLGAESTKDWLEASAASERAGDSYSDSFAYETAGQHYANALEFAARGGLAATERVKLELKLFEALLDSGNNDLASAAQQRATRLAEQTNDASALADCVMAEALLDVMISEDSDLVPRVSEILSQLPEDDLSRRAQLHAVRVELLTFVAPNSADLDDEASQALHLAELSQDPRAIARATYARTIIRWGDVDGHAEWPERLARTESVLLSARESRLASRIGIVRVAALLERGQVDAAELLAREMDRRISSAGLALEAYLAKVRELSLDLFRGVPKAQQHIDELAAVGQSIVPRFSMAIRGGQTIVSASERRDTETLQACLDSMIDLSVGDTSALLLRAFFSQTFRRGQRNVYDVVVERTAHGLPRSSLRLALSCILGELHAWFENESLAERAYAELLPFRTYLAVAGAVTTIIGPVGYTLGRIAHFLNDINSAKEHFAEARDLCKRLQSQPWVQRCDVAAQLLVSPYSPRGGIRPQRTTKREVPAQPRSTRASIG